MPEEEGEGIGHAILNKVVGDGLTQKGGFLHRTQKDEGLSHVVLPGKNIPSRIANAKAL